MGWWGLNGEAPRTRATAVAQFVFEPDGQE